MEKNGYREPINASLEEILERNAQINEIKERFDKLKEDIAKSSNPDDLAKIESEFKEYLKSLGPAYELSVSATQNIDAQANPSVVALGLVNGLTADQLGKCFENAVNAFNTTLENEFRSYQAFNKLKGEHNVN